MKSLMLVAALCIAGPVAFAYQTAAAQGSIEGQVINSDTGAPVRNATVMLSSSSGQPMRPGQPFSQNTTNRVDTDEQGRFTFAGLPAGGYRLSVTRRGVQSYSPQGAVFYVGEQQQLKGVVLKWAGQAVIAGKVLDENGEPVQNAQVSLVRQQYFNGRQQWSPVGNAQTSDLGEYRITVNAPGAYLVSALLRDYMMNSSSQPLPEKPELVYVQTYYPGTTDVDQAAKVTAGATGTVGGIDIKLKRVPAVRIRGRVIDPSPTPNRMASVTLRPKSGSNMPWVGANSMFGMDGGFEFAGVVPGSYVIFATKPLSQGSVTSSSTPVLAASQPIEVGAKPIEGIVLKLMAPKDVRGTVKVEGTSPVFTGFQISAASADGAYYGSAPSATGTNAGEFTLKNVQQGRSLVTASARSADYYVKSIRYGGREIPADGVDLTTGEALEITFSTDGGHIEGSVVDSTGKPLARSVVTFFSTDGAIPLPGNISNMAWTNDNGEFQFRMLRPGNYKVFAWEGTVDQTAARNSDILKAFAGRGTIAQVKAGETVTISLTAITLSEAAGVQPGIVQAPQQHTKGSLEGRVTDLKTGQPLARAIVRFGTGIFMGNNNRVGQADLGVIVGARGMAGGTGFSGAQGTAVETDDQGGFAFRDVEPGIYRLGAERPGYVAAMYGGGGSNTGDQLVIGEGQQVRGVVVKLAPQAVMAGKVLNEVSEPMERAQVTIWRREYAHGQLHFNQVASVQTDDLGEYRVPNMAPGNYIVGARFDQRPRYLSQLPLPKEPDMAYASVYFPNVSEPAQAKAIVLEPGVQATGLDIILRKTPLYRIRGKVSNGQEPPPRTYTVMLTPKDGSPLAQVAATPVARNQDGDFEFFGVAKGAYRLTARVLGPGQASAATQVIEVGERNIEGVVLQPTPGREVVANVSMEDKTPVGQMGLYATMTSVDSPGSVSGGSMNDPSHLTFRDVLPIPYTISVRNVATNYCNCFVQSVRYGGHDIGAAGAVFTSGEQLEIVVSNKAATVEGTVVDKQGKPVPGAALAIIPASGNMAEIKTGSADGLGRFYWPGNPPGEYKLLAWEAADSASLEDPAFLRQFDASAKTVKLEPYAKETTQLTAVPAVGQR